ncbi:MAG: DUF5817 domain-containing protein [Halobacteriaceae archaeon]
MFAVVGCRECSALWVISLDIQSTKCPQCGHQHQVDKLKKFITTENKDEAIELRSAMLAKRQGHADAFANLDGFSELEEQLADAGIDDTEYLNAKGIDVDDVSMDRNESLHQSREEIIKQAIDTLDEPTTESIIQYAVSHGVSEEFSRSTLEKMRQEGIIAKQNSIYRIL